jgi:hypothetical protein
MIPADFWDTRTTRNPEPRFFLRFCVCFFVDTRVKNEKPPAVRVASPAPRLASFFWGVLFFFCGEKLEVKPGPPAERKRALFLSFNPSHDEG